jgi:hypothetical protein
MARAYRPEPDKGTTEGKPQTQSNGFALLMVSLAVCVASYAARLASLHRTGLVEIGLYYATLAIFGATLVSAAVVIASLWTSIRTRRSDPENLAITAGLSACLVALAANAPMVGSVRGNSIVGIAVCLVAVLTIHLAVRHRVQTEPTPPAVRERTVEPGVGPNRIDLADRAGSTVAMGSMQTRPGGENRPGFAGTTLPSSVSTDFSGNPSVSLSPEPEVSDVFAPIGDKAVLRDEPMASQRTAKPVADPFVGHHLFTPPESRHSQIRWCARGNGAQEDSEDAAAISQDENRLALCDGASGSALPRPWSSLIAQHWVEDPFFPPVGATDLAKWLEAPRQEWNRWVLEEWIAVLNERNRNEGRAVVSQNPALHAAEKGASTTALGVTLKKNRIGIEWRAMAIGDTNLFHFTRSRQGWLRELAFPVQTLSTFDGIPGQIPTSTPISTRLPALFQSAVGTCRDGDVLLMATDKLAKWILSQPASSSTEWDRLFSALISQSEFVRFVKLERAIRHLENDDTTVIYIPIGFDPGSTPRSTAASEEAGW